MTHWSEQQLKEHLKRTGIAGGANTASVSRPPFLPAFGMPKDPYEGMNNLERAYAEHLNSEVGRSIVWWAYETVKLKLADRTSYTPDFLVQSISGLLSFHETKGFMREDANVKLKVAAAQFPFSFFLVRKISTGWDISEVGK